MIIGTNFKLSSAKFLDDRQLCKDYNTLITNAEGIIYPPGFEVFCEYENKYYQYILDTNGEYIWEERRSGVSDDESASIKDDTISEKYTWSSAHIDSMRIDLETLITQANDYTDEIDERVLYIEGRLQWFENFDGSYESLRNKPVIPEKISELEDDIDIEGLKNNSHTHINKDILETITEEMINSWNGNVNKIENYNDLLNKPIENIGIDVDLTLNPNDLNKNIYLIKGIICGIQFTNELCIVEPNETKEDIKIIMLNSMKKIVIHKENENWSVIKEENYGIDKNNAKISNSLNIGEGNIIKENNQIVQGKFNEEDVEEKYINIIGNGTSEEDRKNIHTLDWEGNGWYGGKLSQEGVPTEDKDLITKGYADDKYETITNVNSIVDTVNTRIENINTYIDNINKENARRDVIIEALANGRRRTIETDGNDVDLMFSTEKDKVWIDKIEGDTMVNVCDQEEPIAITKSYAVEGTNHVPLQGEYDGKCRPVVQGNTLVNHNREYDKSIIVGERIDSRQGTEILNLEGTPGCEIKVDIDGHTAINLSTKKEDVLCKSFDSASGNEINLVAEENSVSDLVIQGNTMVNLLPSYSPWVATNTGTSNFSVTTKQNYIRVTGEDNSLDWRFIYCGTPQLNMFKPSTTYTLVCTKLKGVKGFHFCATTNQHYIGAVDIDVNNNPLVCTFTTTDTVEINGQVVYVLMPDSGDVDVEIENLMIFEGDLTQTPELIPTEYVEGIQSTFEDKLIPYSIYNGNNLTSITETQYQLPLTVEVGKTYTITTAANVGTTENHKYQYSVYSADGLTNYLEYESCSPTQTFVCDKANILFKVRMYPSYSGDDYSFVLSEVQDKFMIVEGDWSDRLDLLTEEYFGKYKVDMSSCGKNLFDKNVDIVRQSYLDQQDNAVYQDVSFYQDYYIKVNPNKTYTLSSNTPTTLRLQGYDLNKKFIKRIGVGDTTNISITGVNYIRVSAYFNVLDSLQLEEGSTTTEYEPYHGTSKTVYLNSPLLDGDELLTKDGKLCHYHKMGKVVLDGSEDWAYQTHTTGMARFDMLFDTIKAGSQDYCISDKFKTYDVNNSNAQDVEGKILEYIASHSVDGRIIIVIDASKLSITDVNGFKQWLSENPTTVVYELAEPWYEPIGAYGKVMLDGREEWNVITNDASSVNTNYIRFYIDISDIKTSDYAILNCDKFTIKHGISKNTEETCISSHNEMKRIDVCINKSSLPTPDLDGFKQWLQQNPVTVIYELAEPQHIDEDMRFNIATNSTIEYQSNVPMANTQFLPYRNKLPLLESSTQYRVTFDCDVEGIELMVSLGGTSQTITSGLHNELSFITPSLQTDGKLTIDGYGVAKIDNVLITKGDIEYKYFEGLKSGFEEGYIPNSMPIEFSRLESGNINSDTGANMSDPDIVHTPLLTATSDKITFVIVNANYTLHKVILHDSEGNFVTGDTEYIDYLKLGVITVTEGCSQFRLCLRASDVSAINQSNLFILEGDWSHLTEEDFNHLGTYKATIRIQNPNAPIFGKGGRL